MHTESIVVRTAPEAPPQWDAFVSGHGGTFCHLSAWSRIFAQAFGHETVFAWTERDGALTGVLPLVSMPDLPWGRALISMPYLNYGGPVGGTAERAALCAWSLDEADRRGARSLELRMRDPVDTPLSPSREKVTVLLDLPEDPEVLFNDTFRSKLRSQIRRPMKEDMSCSFGPDQLDAFYSVFAENMRDLGTPVLPRRFFSALAHHLPDRVEFGAVSHEGEAVAVGCGFFFGSEFEMTWASSLGRLNRLSPNMLLYWRFMERAIERGAKTFNFGRCTPGGGTHRFKLQWGNATDHPLPWRTWPTPEPVEQGGNADAGPTGAYGVAQRLWRHLPLPVANRLGPILARRLTAF
ncbi:MAG: GNAT family N-acetyltransferase [Longimicrobiales bacterium]